MHQFQERDQLWFGTPDDVIELLERYQANMDNRHFVFWLDFGGMRQELVHRSMHLLAQEVIPHFRRTSLS
jgi:alkanesulfonate monooxygenase SsuD/methylene tetrahydromethanopterin reductase-like flavin-dependent oxidoreductase (luciferase family)